MEKEAIEVLKNGGVVIFPTETVYGLGASIMHPRAVQKIFSLKGRPADNPLIVHVVSIEQALTLSEGNPPAAFHLLAQKFWPGPLTLVIRKKPGITSLISGRLDTIALRMPSHPIALRLLRGAGPLAAPSANLSGRPSPTTLQDALEDFPGQGLLGLDGGPCSIGIESTVVSLIGPQPILLRPGHISASEIEEALGASLGSKPCSGPVLSPGMKYRHYAPKAPVRLVFNEKALQGEVVLRSPRAETFYADLRRLDREGVSQIEIYCDPETQSQVGLMDRILRASSVVG